jgi:UDP-N-acetylmuramoyl-L-alanyl-D-glutamate--2,6-diaminopimelate ligase
MTPQQRENPAATRVEGPGEGASRAAGRPLDALLDALTVHVRPGRTAGITITGIATRSEETCPGMLFVALPGSSADGHAFVADAARRGAAAIVVERDVGGALNVPLVRVEDARQALAELAAAWHGRPADRLSLIGITGTAGKTSTLSILEAALAEGGRRVGSIGSLGLHIQGDRREKTVYTTPDPLVLHQELARLVEADSELVAMEATSHALAQKRVHGLTFRMGIFTNLLPLEHSEYHDDFEAYVRTKMLFFRHLMDGAPLVYNRDDPVTRVLVEARRLAGIAVGTGRRAVARITQARTTAEGTGFALDVGAPIPRLDGGTVGPVRLTLRLRLLGPSNAVNAALAATAALSAGVKPGRIALALAGLAPPRRRLEVVHRDRFTLLDDTVGHPESITAFFDVVEKLRPRAVHIVFAVRGQRGERINGQNGESLAIWARRVGVRTLIVTRSEDRADALNRVEDQELDAFTAPLHNRDVPFRVVDRLEDAVPAALEAAGVGHLVALLGAQAMDDGQEIARAWLDSNPDPAAVEPGVSV